MTDEKALETLISLYNDIDKNNHLFVGTINPELIKVAIKALEYKISSSIIVDEITIKWIINKEKYYDNYSLH